MFYRSINIKKTLRTIKNVDLFIVFTRTNFLKASEESLLFEEKTFEYLIEMIYLNCAFQGRKK